MAEPITLDELCAELERLGLPADRGADGHTALEWAATWKVSPITAKLQIKRFLKAGVMATGRSPRTAMDGIIRPVPVYRVVKQSKKR